MIHFFNQFNVPFLTSTYGAIKGVLCIGAGWGMEEHLYEQMGASRFIWVEPQKEFIEILNQKFGSRNNHTIICEAVGENIHEGTLWIPRDNKGAASTAEPDLKKLRLPEQDIEKQPCTIRDLTTILKVNHEGLEGIDTLVLETQGNEGPVINGFQQLVPPQFRFIFTQIWKSQAYQDCLTVSKLDSVLQKLRYERVETVWVDSCPWGFALYSRELAWVSI